MSFTARYRGICEECSEPVERGQEATYTTTGEGIRHFPFCPEQASQKWSGEVCPRCFTEKSISGECAC